MDEGRPIGVDKMIRPPLPDLFPPAGARVRVPAPGGGFIRTFAGPARQAEDGNWTIRCVGVGDVPAGQVRIASGEKTS